MTTATRIIQVEHVILRSPKSFAEVLATLEHSVPKFNPEIDTLIASGNTKELQKKLEAGPELAIFLSRDHGSLLRIAGQSRKAVQYEIGNPLTASKMTRHEFATGLYAPLRVVLYEDVVRFSSTIDHHLCSDNLGINRLRTLLAASTSRWNVLSVGRPRARALLQALQGVRNLIDS